MALIPKNIDWRISVDNDCVDLGIQTRDGRPVENVRFFNAQSPSLAVTVLGKEYPVQLNGRIQNGYYNPDDIIQKPFNIVEKTPRKPDSDHFKTQHVKNLLKRKHNGDGWAFMFEVSDIIGWVKSRADAIAVNLYKNEIVGFEIKASRGDWLNELKHPEKAERIKKFCDFWYVAAPKDLIKPDELPNGWGLMEATEHTLRIKVRATKLEKTPMTPAFLSSLMRSMNIKK